MTRSLAAGVAPVAIALCAVALVAVACAPTRGGRASVVASTTVIADLAARVAGPDATVESIAPPGASVEDFAPKPEDARRVAEARVILVNGLALDRWVEPLVRNAAPDALVVTLSDDLPRLGVGESGNPDINANGNPHYWFDVKYAKVYVERIRDALTSADPAHRDGYTSRAASYLGDLDKLDAEIKSKVAQIPPARRKLVTSHDAFPYFASAYGLSVVGFVQPEEGKEPSPAELAELVETVKKAQVPAIFSEAQVSPRLAETLAREAGVKTVVADLPTDSLGPPPADSYVGMMRVIVDKIVQALR
jgi:ABC-type Zn uptake system ZnuABC Zn-binding protein ZnuA